MLTTEQVNEHVMVLTIHLDPNSPFHGMVDFVGEGGLLSLPIEEQKQVYGALNPKLKGWVDGGIPITGVLR